MADCLTEPGVVAYIRPIVDHPDMESTDEISVENMVENGFIYDVQQDERFFSKYSCPNQYFTESQPCVVHLV